MILLEEMECVGFLQNMGAPYAGQIAQLAQLQECPVRTVLFRQGQESSFMYFLLRGRVRLEIESASGQAVPAQTLGPGELLGWSPVLGHRRMTATARTTERCRLAALPVERLLALCDQTPRLGIALMRQVAITLAERLEASLLRISGNPPGKESSPSETKGPVPVSGQGVPRKKKFMPALDAGEG